jgi:hypothetical protein
MTARGPGVRGYQRYLENEYIPLRKSRIPFQSQKLKFSQDKTKPQINTDVVNAMNNVIQIHVYNQRKGLYDAQNKVDPNCPSYSILGVFFDALNVAIAKLKDHLTVELLMDDCNVALSKIRNGDRLDRPSVFPTRYTRIWLSNIPCVFP